jgi:hypothetical protein
MPHSDLWCTEKDYRRIEAATSFTQLLNIAMRVIGRNRNNTQPVIQVCGPMASGGGTLEENTERIAALITLLREQGLCVFSQVTFQRGMLNFTTVEDYRRNPLELLEGFYEPLFRGGYIQALIFRHGWEVSLGSRWEHDLGKKLGMPVTYFPKDFDGDISFLPHHFKHKRIPGNPYRAFRQLERMLGPGFVDRHND